MPNLKQPANASQPQSAYESLEAMHMASIRAIIALQEGYRLMFTAINMDGMNRQTLREIMANAQEKAAKEMDSYKTRTDAAY